jgi:hypothetical protein
LGLRFYLALSQRGMSTEAIRGDVLPLIEEPVFVLAGPSDLHFPAPLNLLIAEGVEVYPQICKAFRQFNPGIVLKRNASRARSLTSRNRWRLEVLIALRALLYIHHLIARIYSMYNDVVSLLGYQPTYSFMDEDASRII